MEKREVRFVAVKRENITAMRKQCREEGEHDSNEEAEYYGFLSRLRGKI